MKSGIYKLINLITNKSYIGSAVNLQNRFSAHIRLLRRNRHVNKYLQNSYNKHKEKNFKFEILENCNINNLLEREQYYLDLYKTYNIDKGYNILPKAGSKLGYKLTEETKRKISQSNKGRIISKEARVKTSKSLMGRKTNRPPSLEIVKNLIEYTKNLPKEEILKRSKKATLASLYVTRKSVIMIDKNTNIHLKEFISLAEAERQTKISYKGISDCLNGRKKSAGGFKWIRKT